MNTVATRCAVIAAVLLLSSVALGRLNKPETIRPRRAFVAFPAEVGEWRTMGESPLDPAVVAVLKVDDYLNRTFRRGDTDTLSFYVGYFRSQRVGQTIHSPLVCMPGSGWQPMRRNRVKVSVDAGLSPGSEHRDIEVSRLVVQNGDRFRQLVVYWYQSGGRVVADDYMAKVYKVVDAVRHNRTDGAMVRVVVPMAEPGAVAEKAAEDKAVGFVKAAFPLLPAFVPR